VTFVGLKAGLFLQDGVMCRGALEFADLGIAASLRETQPPLYRRIDDALLAAALPRRRRDAHKGDFGHLLIVGGGPGMPGAVRLCGEAALRCGAGKVSVATHPEHAVQIVTARPELMCHGIRTAEALAALVGQATTLVLGPGLGQDDWGREMYAASMAAERPTVLDADALNLLARDPQRRDDWVLTPHPGEAGRLLGSDGGSVQQDRPGALKALHARYGGTVVLKGAGTLLTAGGQSPFLCSSGNPGMASPGMGDVLAGVIGALLAQGLAAEQAAAAAVEVHARAGDLAAQSGERGLLASDLLACLRQVINR
jgi:NAD(P)H-hydrate epimerase